MGYIRLSSDYRELTHGYSPKNGYIVTWGYRWDMQIYIYIDI